MGESELSVPETMPYPGSAGKREAHPAHALSRAAHRDWTWQANCCILAYPSTMPAPKSARLHRLHLLFAGLPLLLAGCSDLYYYGPTTLGRTAYMEGYDPGDSRYRLQPSDTGSWWRGEGMPGASRIVISLGEQKAFFYKGGKLVGVSALSTGDS